MSTKTDKQPGKANASASTNTENHLGGDHTMIANIASGLIGPIGRGSIDAKKVEDAVRVAKLLLKEATKPSMEHAYELFDPNLVMTANGIAETFADHGWEKLTSSKTISTDVLKILDHVHKEIQGRTASLAVAFSGHLGSLDARIQGQQACSLIEKLLRELGMSVAFGRNLETAALGVWLHIHDMWVVADGKCQNKVGEMKLLTPEYFAEMWTDPTYQAYCDNLHTQMEMTDDQLLAILFWLDNECKPQLSDPKKHDSILESLCLLNECMANLDFHNNFKFNVLGDLIFEIRSDQTDDVTIVSALERGVKRLSEVYGRKKFLLFLEKLDLNAVETLSRELSIIWHALSEDEQISLGSDPYCIRDTFRAIDGLASGCVPTSVYWSRFWSNTKHVYLRYYDSCLRDLLGALGSLKGVAKALNQDDKVANIVDNLRQQILQEIESASCYIESLVETPSDFDQKVALIREQIKAARKSINFGNLNPHKLFKYAYDHSVLSEKLSRRKP